VARVDSATVVISYHTKEGKILSKIVDSNSIWETNGQ